MKVRKDFLVLPSEFSDVGHATSDSAGWKAAPTPAERRLAILHTAL